MGAAFSKWPEATTDIDTVYAQAQTGDIIMFQGQGADAGLIRSCSPTDRWSHVGVVVVMRSGQKYITEAYADVIEVEDRRTGRVVPAICSIIPRASPELNPAAGLPLIEAAG